MSSAKSARQARHTSDAECREAGTRARCEKIQGPMGPRAKFLEFWGAAHRPCGPGGIKNQKSVVISLFFDCVVLALSNVMNEGTCLSTSYPLTYALPEETTPINLLLSPGGVDVDV